MSNNKAPPVNQRLANSAYNSPYTRVGAPGPHPNTDPYATLRAKALETLESMGYDPATMAEHGVVWAEDQDPFGHVMQSQFMRFFGVCFHRVMESYADYLDEEEYEGMVKAKTVVPVMRRYELSINRQVKYPDALIAAYFQGPIEPTRNYGTTVLFSLNQQAVVAEAKGSTTFMDVKSGRPIDITSLGGGWPKVFEGMTKKGERSASLKAKWEREHPKRVTATGSAKL